jgi:hypothetical protein
MTAKNKKKIPGSSGANLGVGGYVVGGCGIEGDGELIQTIKPTQVEKKITKTPRIRAKEEMIVQMRKSRKMSSLFISSLNCLTAINIKMKPTRGKIKSSIAPIPPIVFRFLKSTSFISSILHPSISHQ